MTPQQQHFAIAAPADQFTHDPSHWSQRWGDHRPQSLTHVSPHVWNEFVCWSLQRFHERQPSPSMQPAVKPLNPDSEDCHFGMKCQNSKCMFRHHPRLNRSRVCKQFQFGGGCLFLSCRYRHSRLLRVPAPSVDVSFLEDQQHEQELEQPVVVSAVAAVATPVPMTAAVHELPMITTTTTTAVAEPSRQGRSRLRSNSPSDNPELPASMPVTAQHDEPQVVSTPVPVAATVMSTKSVTMPAPSLAVFNVPSASATATLKTHACFLPQCGRPVEDRHQRFCDKCAAEKLKSAVPTTEQPSQQTALSVPTTGSVQMAAISVPTEVTVVPPRPTSATSYTSEGLMRPTSAASSRASSVSPSPGPTTNKSWAEMNDEPAFEKPKFSGPWSKLPGLMKGGSIRPCSPAPSSAVPPATAQRVGSKPGKNQSERRSR